MKPKRILTAFGLAAAVLIAAIQPQTMVAAGVPTAIHYQGRVAVSGLPFDGTGHFKFALIGPGATAGSVVTYWSHDGTSQNGSEPTSSVPVTVIKGIYSVLLGDTQVPGETAALSPGVFDHERVELRVWFGGGADPVKLLSPDQRVTSVAYALLAGEAATARGVVNGAVGSGQLADRSVTAVKIQPGAVGTAQLGDGSVTTAKLAAKAVGREQLADHSIDSDKLVPGSITHEVLSDGAVSALKIQPSAVGSSQLGVGSVTTAKLAAKAVGREQLADQSVDTSKLADGSVTAAKLAPVLSGTLKADRFEGDGTGLRGVVTAAPDLRMVRGMIKADGSVFIGEGFTASRIGNGVYKIQYQKPFLGVPIIVGSPATPGGTVSWNLPGLDSVELTTTIGGTVQDAYFTFIAIGPR